MMTENTVQTAENYLAARVQELEAALGFQKELNRKNIDSIDRLRNDIVMLKSGRLLTKVEAWEYVQSEDLPLNFGARLESFIEFYECDNCDGRLCMGCVFREWNHTCANDCPDCCKDGHLIEVVTVL